ncbi:protein kinase-like protein, partial [Metarhizium majus ARSEF 297]
MVAQPKVFPTVGFETVLADEPIEEEELPNYKAERYYPVLIGQVLQDRYQITGKLGFGGGSTVWACRDLKYVADEPIEEEELPNYKAERYYPVLIGQVLQDRYQITGKLGFGGGSTVWACRDLKQDAVLTIKICATGETGEKDARQEVAVSDHIKSIDAPHHPGQALLRIVRKNFEIDGPNGNHQCLLFAPLGRPLTEFRKLFPGNALDSNVLRQTLLCIIMGLDFLHQVGVVHTDLSPNNILAGLGPQDSGVFDQIEELELATPSPRKVLPDRMIYLSYQLPITHGAPVITDYGAARLGEPGEKHSGDVMPGVYRAPEIIMGADWDSKIDMWSLGVMVWDLFEGGRLFRAISADRLDDQLHLAEMVSLLGPPPRKFLEMHQESRKYWDSDGNWIASTPIPDQSLESRETRLEGKEKQLFLTFVRKVLCWLPEDRTSADELYDDEFLNGYIRHEGHVAAERAALDKRDAV